MYSPKIRENLIPRIYRTAKKAGVKMTTWVNNVIEQALPAEETENQETNHGGRENERTRRKEVAR